MHLCDGYIDASDENEEEEGKSVGPMKIGAVGKKVWTTNVDSREGKWES